MAYAEDAGFSAAVPVVTGAETPGTKKDQLAMTASNSAAARPKGRIRLKVMNFSSLAVTGRLE